MPDLIPFAYHNHAVRTMQHDDGSTWWAAADVCAALKLSNPSRVCDRLQDDEKDTLTFSDSVGRPHELLLVNEPGLYRLIMRSSKPEAKAFQHWVTHEVLPSIRKTGTYGQPATPAVLNPEHQMMIDMIVQLDRTEQRAIRAEATATRAEGKADMAMEDAHRMTLEEFVLANGLLRQMPRSRWQEYARWLTDFCLTWQLKGGKARVPGRNWEHENAYPITALGALLHHEQTKPRQVTLIHG